MAVSSVWHLNRFVPQPVLPQGGGPQRTSSSGSSVAPPTVSSLLIQALRMGSPRGDVFIEENVAPCGTNTRTLAYKSTASKVEIHGWNLVIPVEFPPFFEGNVLGVQKLVKERTLKG